MFQAKNKELTTKQIITEAENVANDSYASAQRSLAVAEQTRTLGAETLDTLNNQGQQIKNVQIHLDKIEHLQNKADRNISAINSIGGVVTNKFRLEPKAHDNVKKGDKKVQHQLNKEKRKLKKKSKQTENQIINMWQADLSMLPEETQKTIQKTDQVVDQIGTVLDNLKTLAMEMGDEITEHNVRLGIVEPQMAKANIRMNKTNAKIRRQI